MRILRVHNRYQERGGEDVSFEAEVDLLSSHGEEVQTLVVSNEEIPARQSPVGSLELAVSTVWSRKHRRRVAETVSEMQADVVHVDNFFPLISPGAYSAARDAGAAVVQTLHNYRLVCPNALFYRDGRPCEDCLGKTPPLPGVIHACYRDSRAQTAVVAAMLTTHRLRRTWQHDVDRYIVMTQFARQKFIDGGLPADKLTVKPNFIDSNPSAPVGDGRYVLFVGRLSPEKGIATLLRCWDRNGSLPPLRIAGDGPVREEVDRAAASNVLITALGRLSRDAVLREMSGARALVFPSEWYEGLPLTIVEVFACGVPVIASRLGAMAEIIDDGRTGLLFEPGNAEDLMAKVSWAWAHPAEMRRMGENARQEYEHTYTPERNYQMLMDIYRQAIDHSRSRHA